MIEDIREAIEQFREAEQLYREGDCREALHLLHELAYYVTSNRTKRTVPAEELEPLTTQVRRAIAGYQSCDDECAWESASGLMDLFRQA